MSTVAPVLERHSPPEQATPFARRATARRFFRVYLPPLLVSLVAAALAAVTYAEFYPAAWGLWHSVSHDRNAHYWFGALLGLDMQAGDVGGLIHHLHWARVWGPLHPLVLGLVLLIGGVDYHLGVLPSLGAWVGAALFAFLAARRAVPRGGNLAGAVAALLVLSSPAHKAYATDIMLESLGACLTLAALYAYLRAVQERTVWSGRLLGLTLTLLFFHKYNYWLLVIFGLSAAAVAARPWECWGWVRHTIASLPWREWGRAQLRNPLNYLLVFLVGASIFLHFSGLEIIHLGSWQIKVRTQHNLVHAAFVVLVLRMWPWWWRQVRPWLRQQANPLPQVVYWHVWPAIVWFLWPQRLGYFLWYLNAAHPTSVDPKSYWMGGVGFFAEQVAVDYHQNLWALAAALGLAGLALTAVQRLRPGGAALLWFAAIATVLTFSHTCLKGRCLHSWIAILWVLAGVGLASWLFCWWGHSWRRWRNGAGVAVLAGLAALQMPGLLRPGHAQESGLRPQEPCVLEMTEAYLPHLQGARGGVVLSDCEIKFFTAWTYFERFGRNPHFFTEARTTANFPKEEQGELLRWLDRIACERLLLIDLPPGSPSNDAGSRLDPTAFRAMMASQTKFGLERRWRFAGGAEVLLWRRDSASGG